MKVYVASHWIRHESDITVGVFSTKEKAWEYLSTRYKNVGDLHDVTEMELDVGA